MMFRSVTHLSTRRSRVSRQQISTTVMTRIVVDKSADHAKLHFDLFLFFSYHNIKYNERNLCQDVLTIPKPTRA